MGNRLWNYSFLTRRKAIIVGWLLRDFRSTSNISQATPAAYRAKEDLRV